MTETYRVTGMTCDGCARAVTNAIKARSPAARVSVDLRASEVHVDGEPAPDQIRAAVEDAGFEFGGKI